VQFFWEDGKELHQNLLAVGNRILAQVGVNSVEDFVDASRKGFAIRFDVDRLSRVGAESLVAFVDFAEKIVAFLGGTEDNLPLLVVDL